MSLRQRLYLSTIADDACPLAQEYQLGLEIAEFCTASNMDENFSTYGPMVSEKMKAAHRFVFHAPFNELCPAAIDPMAVELTRKRYLQSFALARQLGIRRIVAHTGYIPTVYYKSWMIDRSISFWQALLLELPENMELLLENVMEDGPELQLAIASGVADPRLRLCLDIGHANAQNSKTPVAQWVPPLTPYLSHVHLHNNDSSWDQHQNLDGGAIPMAALLRQLEAACPGLTYTIETMHARPSVAFLEQHGFLEP